jgi:transposase
VFIEGVGRQAFQNQVVIHKDNRGSVRAQAKSAAVTGYAKEHGIGLIFLPPYSPNLNLIERFWKLVKVEVLNAAYHGTFDEFKSVIDSFIAETGGKHKKKVSTVISDNVPVGTREAERRRGNEGSGATD